MIEKYFTQARILARLQEGPLGPCLLDVLKDLDNAGYSRCSIRRGVRNADRFLRWVQKQRIDLAAATPAHLQAFAIQHGRLPDKYRRSGRQPQAVIGLTRIAAILRQHGILVGREPQTPQEHWLKSFDDYLAQVRGLSRHTRRSYLQYAKRLMHACFLESRDPDWGGLTASQICEFVRQQAGQLQPGSCAQPVSAVRALVSFLAQQGLVPAQLSHAIPRFRKWRLADLPRYLDAKDRDCVVNFCQQSSSENARDRGIVLLLARLGMRAGEVRQLQLEDLDWAQGVIHVRAGKSRRERVLPLFDDVGRTLAHYLREERPCTSSRAVFIRSLAPHDGLGCSSAITRIVSKLCARAGVIVPHVGAHRLRHTAATYMVRGGASFKEVADILGHRSLESTHIYAKLDERSLATIALPWPGGER